MSVKRMIDKLFPWHSGLVTTGGEERVMTSRLIETIDTLVCDDMNDDGQTQVSLRDCNILFIFRSM